MSAFENARDVYDVKLKPRMLIDLIREHLPDENEPSRIPLGLSEIISTIRTHKLLSESFGDSMDNKFVESWKSAVDKWVNRLLKLVSSSLSDKCWIGICLLGLTCQECKVDRFLASYSVWFNKLFQYIQQSSESQFLKVASCNSLAAVFERLDDLPNAKKDGSSLAGKVIQPVLKLLTEHSSEVWEGAVQLLCTILTYFPASVHRYHESAEAAIASKLFSGNCSVDVMKKFAYCLALLPRSKGDNESWCLMMQKILLFINIQLNDFFQGLEEETRGSEAIRELVPPGNDSPPPLGGDALLGQILDKGTRSERLLASGVSMLILCCCKMLTCSYPVRVSVPTSSLLALVDRVLKVDGSVPRASLPFMTAMQQECVCVLLPELHLYSLKLLLSIIESMRSQLMPYAACIVRLAKGNFKQCALPELRIKLYSIMKSLMTFMGIGMAASLAQEVVDHASIDLNPVGQIASTAVFKPAYQAPMQSSHRKRKHTAVTILEEQHDITGLPLKAPKIGLTSPISLRIAALEALETLLTVGATLRSEAWRMNVDHLLINLATDSIKFGWGDAEKNIFLPSEPTSVDLQLATLRVLLASLLSPARVRPTYLARALELFRKGKLEGGTEVASFCAHALLTLEVLIHPRALPLLDSSSANYNSFGKHSSLGHGAPDLDADDLLYEKWLENGNLSEDHLNNAGNDHGDIIMAPETVRVEKSEMAPVAGSSGTSIMQRNMGKADVSMRSLSNDHSMTESKRFQELEPNPGFSGNFEGAPGLEMENTTPDGGLDSNKDKEVSGKDLLGDNKDRFANGGDTLIPTPEEKGKGSFFDLDGDSSLDEFPDIVEVEPDSDV